ncbi:MAG: hypothetical protein HY367_01045 [Candidatus Aenigmarchaeota archaeon]|nr:hypothetical protein [Candidatus Aenigmarchaeota archaeon]
MKRSKKEEDGGEEAGPSYKLKGKFPFLETEIDKLYQLVKQRGKVSVYTASKELGQKKESIESMAKILEEHGMAELHYPLIGPPTLALKGYAEQRVRREGKVPAPPKPTEEVEKLKFKPEPSRGEAAAKIRLPHRRRLPSRKAVGALVVLGVIIEFALYMFFVDPQFPARLLQYAQSIQQARPDYASVQQTAYIVLIAAVLLLAMLAIRRKLRERRRMADRFRKVQKEIKEIEKLAAGEKPEKEGAYVPYPVKGVPWQKPGQKEAPPEKRKRWTEAELMPAAKPPTPPEKGEEKKKGGKVKGKEKKKAMELRAKKRKKGKPEESITPESPIYYT